MERITGQMFQLAIAGLILLFCIGAILYGIGEEDKGILALAGNIINSANERVLATEHGSRLEQILKAVMERQPPPSEECLDWIGEEEDEKSCTGALFPSVDHQLDLDCLHAPW